MGCGGCRKAFEVNKLRMALNATKSASRAIKAYVQGKPVFSTAEMFNKRVFICKSCPSNKYIPEKDRCAACGCFIKSSIAGAPGKATLINEKCPKGHW